MDRDPNRDLIKAAQEWSICVGAPALFHEVPAVWTDEEQLNAMHASWQLAPQVDYLRAHLVDLEGACDPDQLSQTADCLAGSART